MSIFRTRGSTPVAVPQYTGLQIQTSSSALPIPIVYGRTQIAPNMIWADNFQSHPQYSQQSGGKGGGGGQATLTGYTYSTAVIFAICEGPIATLGTVYQGQAQQSAASLGLSVFAGTTPQAPWGYLSSSYPDVALGYQGTAFAASAAFDLGSSASINAIAFEVYGRFAPQGGVNAADSDPAVVIADFLTNAQYGVGFPAGSIDATSLYGVSGSASYQTYCQAMGLAFSPALTDQETGNSILARWLQLTNSTAVWSAGRLKIMPYGDATVTGPLSDGSMVTYRPGTDAVYDLDDDAFIYDGSHDPVTVARIDPYAASNLVRLEALDRANQYSATPVEARDQNAIELYGLRIASTVTAHEFCDTAIASVAAQLILQRGLYIRNTYAFQLSWDYCLLEPMDLVTLTDQSLGLAKTPVRILSIEEDESGLLSVTAEEFPGAVGTAIGYATSGASSTSINRNVAAAPVNPPVIFEPPAGLTGGVAQIWLGLSGGTNGVADPTWGGATIYLSIDGTSYTVLGTLTTPARQGILAQPLDASSSGPLSLDVRESGAVISSSALGASSPSLCLVDDEIVGYTSAVLSGAGTYALNGLQRGLYARPGTSHALGAPVLCLDAAVYRYNLPDAYIGQPLWLKFASFNVFGAGTQDLATCAAYAITPVGSGLFGPVAQALSQGTALDEGAASLATSESDSYGLASDPYTEVLDLGLASDDVGMVPIAAGGTGATTPAAARDNIGAAASGANSDITSLSNLTALGIGISADATNRLAVQSPGVLFGDVGGGIRIAINKTTSESDADLLFQTGYSGRAAAGLLASDRYRINVSAAGTVWSQALDIDPATGHVGLAGYSADATNALGVNATAVLLNAASDSCRLTVNKAATGDDAALIFETGFSARALLGLLASDKFELKLSADGESYRSVFTGDPVSGTMTLTAPLTLGSFDVVTLPPGAAGALAFATDGRKAGEGPGAGTGVAVLFSNNAWRRLSDDAIVTN